MLHFPEKSLTEGSLASQTAHDLRHILMHALIERRKGRGTLSECLGLSGSEITVMRNHWLPGLELPDLDCAAPVPSADQQAIATLVLWRGGVATDEARWLSAILARRAMEPRHLWEDLGLPARPYLTRLIARELPGLAAANSQNMRWKKFFYRQICSDAAFSLCLSPSCDECEEKAECFAPA